MSSLVLCPGCARHVKSDETACPFCQGALVPKQDRGVCAGPCSGHRFPRLGRAALVAAGAALLCTSCQLSTGQSYGTSAVQPTVDAGGQTDAGLDSGDAVK